MTLETNRQGMRILFDTNVWRYVIDAGAEVHLHRAIARSKAILQAAPAVLYETLRMRESETRNKIIRLITNQKWRRLMPEAFSEAAELKAEIHRLRPEWLRTRRDVTTFQRFRYDWRRNKGGFWSRVQLHTEEEAARIAYLDGNLLETARAQAYQSRQEMLNLSPNNAHTPLNNVMAMPIGAIPGWEGQPVEYWRIASLYSFHRLLYGILRGAQNHPYEQWLGDEVDWAAMYANDESFNRFWLYEVIPAALPRFWLRSAFEFLQQWHKVTDGTPCDSQLATYLVESDAIISADKNFIRFAERSRQYAPFPVARPYQLAGGIAGISKFLGDLEGGRLFEG